jgi:23S rRNA pseudouridine2605 synthase
MIRRGRVEVNGAVVTDLPAFVDTLRDRIAVDGKTVWKPKPARSPRPAGAEGDGPGWEAEGVGAEPAEPAGPAGPARAPRAGRGAVARRIYLLVSKPPRVVTTLRDEAGRATIADLVKHPAGARLYPVGRLGFHMSGLVLMTNDGELAHRLTHARFGVRRTYRVWVRGHMSQEQLEEVRRTMALVSGAARRRRAGAALDSGDGPGATVTLVEHTGDAEQAGQPESEGPGRVSGVKTVLDIEIGAARDAKIDMLLAQAGCKFARLSQVALGPLRLTAVPQGAWRELTTGEVAALYRAVGLRHGGGAGEGPARGGATR